MRQIFEKYSSIKFYEKKSAGSRAVLCARMGKYDEVFVILRRRLEATRDAKEVKDSTWY